MQQVTLKASAPAPAGPAGHPPPAVKPAATPSGPQKDVPYTCPMHPQVRQMGPGNCPICGMTLEPVAVTAESGDSPELHDMSMRFWIGLALTAPVFALEMGGHLINLHSFISAQAQNWIQFALATPVVFWAGWPFFQRAGPR